MAVLRWNWQLMIVVQGCGNPYCCVVVAGPKLWYFCDCDNISYRILWGSGFLWWLFSCKGVSVPAVFHIQKIPCHGHLHWDSCCSFTALAVLQSVYIQSQFIFCIVEGLLLKEKGVHLWITSRKSMLSTIMKISCILLSQTVFRFIMFFVNMLLACGTGPYR
jgi:hypothetical protein